MIGVNGDSQPMLYLNADMTRSRYTALPHSPDAISANGMGGGLHIGSQTARRLHRIFA